MKLNTETAVSYLRDKGVVPEFVEIESTPLGGGVSNGVFRINWDDDELVVKQPLADLNVEEDWPADVNRVHNEAAAARVYNDILEETRFSGLVVPSVRLEDCNEHVLALTAAPTSARMWKSDLLSGTVNSQVGSTLGGFLAVAHRHTEGNKSTQKQFNNYTPFEQLRLEPYHETVADRHPDVSGEIEREVERLRSRRVTLVHGDFSPKNVLVDDSNSTRRLWLLDFEVAHWGDPVFDVSFMLNHLFIKSLYNHTQCVEYTATAEAFWDAYESGSKLESNFERSVLVELGVLMLARVDGKSPVEYVENAETKSKLRTLAKRAIRGDLTSLEAFCDAVQKSAE
ncbi:hypothetical protein C5C07_19240 [Haloferax sp. Atlit-4N]|uniref:phosphotransferase family protein n=1 Tax=unclassified Haloferax TaxID=2625095 RepID=UPI000E227069|nr:MULTISPECIES: aminoglycoside phosphotransferase family protein [unclassified Haloferax]RDZ39507.1 hypothetical protein C5B86_19075 [Haloferax sp. Atlit-19N]RDZ50217.1 hypothetical protein C5C07_19240 [Haloferax sp. Atlit-4N]